MTDQTRADFESYFGLTTRQAWQHPDGNYKFPEIQAKWEGYQAGVAKAAPVADMELLPYLRQYRHNDGSDGFVFAYEKEGVDRHVALLRSELAAPVAAAAPVADDKESNYLLSDIQKWWEGYHAGLAAAAAPDDAKDATQFPRTGCNDRPACREAGSCRDNTGFCLKLSRQ